MKIKHFLLFVVSFFVFEFKVNALVCNYNISGYEDDDLYWVVDSDESKPAEAKINMIGGLLTDAGREPVLNWEDSTGYSASEDINSGKCPEYLIQTYAQGGFHGYEVFMSDSSHLSSIVNDHQDYLVWNADLSVIVFKLANRKKDSNVAVTCAYSHSDDSDFKFNLLYDKNGNLIGTDAPNNWYQAKTILSYTAYEEKLNSNSCNINAYRCFDGEIGYNRVYLNSSGFMLEDRTFSADYALCPKYDFNQNSSDSTFQDPVTSDTACKWYSEYVNELSEAAKKYGDCNKKDNSCGSAMNEFNQAEKKVETFCKSIYSMAYYSDSCVQKCTELDNKIFEIKKTYGIDTIGDNEKCGLTSRVLNWVMKIINWLRYIVPVLLILLSILDFIKAIAADNEDEVKKVTSKFVKRLIVAVIIFLLPLSLEFLLGIFGINTNNFCL